VASELPLSPREEIEGIVHFRRMLHKIRLNQAGDLHSDYQSKLGQGFDSDCCDFLGIDYQDVVDVIKAGASDEEALEKVLEHGNAPSPYEVEVWSAYLSKRGWRDSSSEGLAKRKEELHIGHRDEVQTFFDLIDADEGREITS